VPLLHLHFYPDLPFAAIKIIAHVTDTGVNNRGREGRAMDTTDNRFIRRQLDAMHEAEREIVYLYAESCFLNIQIVLGNVSNMDKLEQLADALVQAERQFQLSRAALHRLGVPSSEMAGLSEQQRLELFEVRFKDPHASSSFLRGLFERSDLRDMLDDISAPFPAGIPN
jgi:hypothetical protein